MVSINKQKCLLHLFVITYFIPVNQARPPPCSSSAILGVVLEDDPEGVDHAGDVGEEGEEDVEEEGAAAAAHQEDRDGREEQGEDQGDEPATISRAGSHPGLASVVF